jgi:hypothetical protein
MSFLNDVLTVGGVHQDDIARLEKILDEHATALHQGRPDEPSVAMFGGSSSGADLDLQTMRAYDHVRKAVDELVLGLQGYRENIVRFARDYDVTDTEVHGDLTVHKQAIDAIEGCTTPTDFHDSNVCAAPTAENDD